MTDRITIATDMARERLAEAGLGNGNWLGVPYLHPDGRTDMLAGITVSAADIDAQIKLERERGVERDSAPATSAPDTDAHGRLTDARIAELLEDALALGGCFAMNECDAAAVLVEVQESRAALARMTESAGWWGRIAARAMIAGRKEAERLRATIARVEALVETLRGSHAFLLADDIEAALRGDRSGQ